MHVTLVHVSVKPAHIAEFIEATRRNHEASVQEPGNRRFDVLQSPDDPGQFVLYEAYASAEDAAAHKETAHYAKWRDTVEEMMAEAREQSIARMQEEARSKGGDAITDVRFSTAYMMGGAAEEAAEGEERERPGPRGRRGRLAPRPSL